MKSILEISHLVSELFFLVDKRRKNFSS